jgi:hypothetical protein
VSNELIPVVKDAAILVGSFDSGYCCDLCSMRNK